MIFPSSPAASSVGDSEFTVGFPRHPTTNFWGEPKSVAPERVEPGDVAVIQANEFFYPNRVKASTGKHQPFPTRDRGSGADPIPERGTAGAVVRAAGLTGSDGEIVRPQKQRCFIGLQKIPVGILGDLTPHGLNLIAQIQIVL